jgi:3',5'-cyclic AMP phosphodiesterase CpdA
MRKHVLGLVVASCVAALGGTAAAQETFSGVVYEDANGNSARDDGEAGVAGVSVSNGVQVVQTDQQGRYELPRRNRMVVFVSKPQGYMVPVDENKVPQFSYIHQPQGSPEFIQEYRGVAPTGPLPESVDFPLVRHDEPDNFRFIVFGDTQVTTQQELNYLRDSAIAELADSDALFGVAVGDLVNDPLHLFPRYQEVMGSTSFPTFYLPGNHDINFDSPDDEFHLETYKRHFGAPYYSFDYGQTHFVLFDNIRYNVDEGFEGTYNGRVSDEQLAWFENDLRHVDPDKLIVLAMHVALSNYVDRDSEKHQETRRDRIYQILEEGGFENVISLAGHSHTLERLRPGEVYNPGTVTNDDGEQEESFGWGEIPFPQFVAGAVCGSWWSGTKDELGIPASYMRCGTPKGYQVFDVRGNQYSEFWKVSGSDAAMHISLDMPQKNIDPAAPEAFSEMGIVTTSELGNEVVVVANVYAGGRDTQVEMQLDGGQPVEMTWDQEQRDPFAIRLQPPEDEGLHTQEGMSYHLYTARLPADLEPGAHTIRVRAVDPYGQEWTGSKVFDVWSDF